MFYCLRLLRMSLNFSGCNLNWWLSAKRWEAAKQLAIVLALLCVDYYVDLDDVLYSLDQMPRFYLFHHAILCGFYLRAATIREWCLLNLGQETKKSTTQGRWSGCRPQEVNPKRCCHACHCNRYRAWGIRRGQRWVGVEWICSKSLLIQILCFLLSLNCNYCILSACFDIAMGSSGWFTCTCTTQILAACG